MGVKVKQLKGAWWVFVNHQGQRKAKRVGVCKTAEKAAELAALEIQARLARGDLSVLTQQAPTRPAAAPTFAELAAEWLRKYPALHAIRASTAENYRSFTERHLLPHFGAMPITNVTATTIEDFIEMKRLPGGSVRFQGKALGDSSLRTGLLALRLIFQRAVRTKLIPANPMNEVEWRGVPRIEHVDPFTVAELRAILQAARGLEPDVATLFQVWAQSGMRAGEVLGLQPQDVDLDGGTVLVRRTWTRRRLGPTKTGRERLVCFLHPVAEDISDWRPGAGQSRAVLMGLRQLKVQSLDPAAFLFTRRGVPWFSQSLNQVWRRALLAARVRYRSPEQLRHTFASTMLSRNAPLLYVQKQGGWRSAGVLLSVYARWLPQDGVTESFEQPHATLAQPRGARRAGDRRVE